jgi:hypothetical protein
MGPRMGGSFTEVTVSAISRRVTPPSVSSTATVMVAVPLALGSGVMASARAVPVPDTTSPAAFTSVVLDEVAVKTSAEAAVVASPMVKLSTVEPSSSIVVAPGPEMVGGELPRPSTRRSRPLERSAITRRPLLSSATPAGSLSPANAAGPPSPENVPKSNESLSSTAPLPARLWMEMFDSGISHTRWLR